ncbi:50S ribosomal protein L32 [Candidatus Saganbacteria bacterium]|nr:50S ribosomal protein L32 [Candidatus Saganbacteria bacterium]
MPVPKKRHSRSRQGKRRAESFRAHLPGVGACPSCGAPKRPHYACAACGTYKGRAVIRVKQKKNKAKEK